MTKLFLTLDLNFDEFMASGREEFISDLAILAGVSPEEIFNVRFHKACVIFEGELDSPAAQALCDLFDALSSLGDHGELPAELREIAGFVEKYRLIKFSKKGVVHVHLKRSKENVSRGTVAFVHGWSGNTDSFGLLPKWISEATGLNSVVYPYPTGFGSSSPAIPFVAQNFDNWVRNVTETRKGSLAIFAHSMGGVIVRKMLCGQYLRELALDERIGQLTFVSSPYVGVWVAGVAKRYLRTSDAQVRDLSHDSPHLTELNASWLHWKEKNKELKPYIRSIYGTQDTLVPPALASVDDKEAIPILGADHSNIVKPTSPDSEIVETLVRLLREAGMGNSSVGDRVRTV